MLKKHYSELKYYFNACPFAIAVKSGICGNSLDVNGIVLVVLPFLPFSIINGSFKEVTGKIEKYQIFLKKVLTTRGASVIIKSKENRRFFYGGGRKIENNE